MQARYKFIFILTAALSTGLSFPAYGRAVPARSAEYSKCMEKSEGVDPAMLDCTSAEYSRVDKRLNNAYKKLMGKLKAERKKELQEVQRLWLKFTDANCQFYYDPDGGTSARLSSNECSVTARILRAEELEMLTPD
jgi:uncharacterized protein YecT (DUF1311 family)